MMKPIMLKVFTKELENLNWDQKAISVASHNGTSEHVKAAQSLLPNSDWGLMQTPLDLPLVQFGRQVRRARRWYSNSAGQHAAILLGCRRKGWNRAGYTLPNHPFFFAFLEQVRHYLGEECKKEGMIWQSITCSIPSFTTTTKKYCCMLT
jgi:L-asparaginase II